MTFTGAGYTGKLIIQDMIPGNDEYMRVLTSYSDHNGKVKNDVPRSCASLKSIHRTDWAIMQSLSQSRIRN